MSTINKALLILSGTDTTIAAGLTVTTFPTS